MQKERNMSWWMLEEVCHVLECHVNIYKYILLTLCHYTGTVDVACHEILADFGVKEIIHPSGGKWGSCYIDDQFIGILKDIFGKYDISMDEFSKEEPAEYIQLMHNFQIAKADFYFDKKKNVSCQLPQKFLEYLEAKLVAY